MHVVNSFRTWNGPPKFCIDLVADWLIISDEVRGKSPGKKVQSITSIKYWGQLSSSEKLIWLFANEKDIVCQVLAKSIYVKFQKREGILTS